MLWNKSLMLDRPDPLPRLAQRGGYARLVSTSKGCIRSTAYWIRNSLCYFVLLLVFDRVRDVSNRSIIVVVSPRHCTGEPTDASRSFQLSWTFLLVNEWRTLLSYCLLCPSPPPHPRQCIRLAIAVTQLC